MESAEYKKQYDEYLARAEKALSQACERYLPEESDVCRAARYSLLGRAASAFALCWCWPCVICSTAMPRQLSSLQPQSRCCTAIRSSMMTCPAWITTICAAASPPATRHSANPPRCWPVTSC